MILLKKIKIFNNQPGRREKKQMLCDWRWRTNFLLLTRKKKKKSKVLFWKFSNGIISATKRPIDLFQKPR